MITLPQITLLAMGSEKYREANQKALDISSKQIEFGAVKNVILDLKSLNDYSKAMIYELPKYVDTPFVLTIQADGWITHHELWNDDWLNYDYIGAPWPLPKDKFSYRANGEIIRVGNGAVSLRSKRLINLANELKLEWKPFYGYYNEDGFICVNYRQEYLKAGMKFAPLEVAKFFSKEHTIPENEGIIPFAFHKYENI